MELSLNSKSTTVVKIPTDYQKVFIINSPNEVGAIKNKFFTLFDEKTKKYKVNEEILNAKLIETLRSLLDCVLIEIPFSNISNGTSGLDLESYNELCTIHDISKMEWGLIQKACNLILGSKPDVILDGGSENNFSSFAKKMNCLHLHEKEIKFCSMCDGLGRLKSNGKPSSFEIRIRYYNNIVNEVKKLYDSISKDIEVIKESILLEVFSSMSDREKFNMDGEIAKRHGKQATAPKIITN